MTVCAEVRTIPQHIERPFALLAPDFAKLARQEDNR
jgi:ATP adenylyltransferase